MEFIFKNISHSYWFVIILAHIIWSQNTTDRAKPVPVLSDKHVLASYFPPVENHAPLNDRWREAGPPFMRTFTSEDYGDYYQFWKIARDDRTGLMYFLSQGVLLEYDGVTWREVTKKMSWNSQSLATDSTGRLWCASIHQVGFLEPDSTGFLKFQSLVQHIPAAIKDSTKLWKIAMTSRYVYFQSGRFLLRWSKNAHTMKSWRSATGFGIPHTMDDTFYIREKGVGLMRVDGDQLRVLPGSAHLSKMVISDIIPFSGSYDKPNNDRTTSRSHHSLLILTRTHGMFIYERGRFYTFNTEADVYLKQNRLECGAVLPDKSLALGTIHGGLMILSPEGKLRNILTKSEGLNDNTVYDILYDNRNGLWLALNKGIMRLEYPGPFSHFTEPAALKSSVNAIVRHKGKLYATTTDGVYTLEQSPRPGFPPVFRAISGLKAQTGRLLSAGGRLLIGSNKGVDELIPEDERTSAKEVRKVAQTGTPGCLVQSRLDSERVYVGLNNGVALLHLQSGKWQYTGSFAVGNDWIEGIAEENNKTLWLTTRDGVVYKITAPSLQPSTLLNKENILIQRFSKSNNLPPIWVNPLIYKNKILFTTTKGIRYFDSPTQTFQIDSSLTELFADTSWYFNWIKLNFDQKGRIWTTRKDNIGLASRNAQGRYTWDETPFKYLSDLGGTWTFCIDPDYPGVYWFGGSYGIVRYDENIRQDDRIGCHSLIRQVMVNGDSAIYGGAYTFPEDVFPAPQLTFDHNTVRFQYAAPYYNAPDLNMYQFYLEGFEAGWSKWTKETMVDYRQLPPGHYRFHLRARNYYNSVCEGSVFAFTILPPWYKTPWAYTIYAFLIVALLLAVRHSEVNRHNHKMQAYLQKREAEKLKEMDILKTRFFTNISHEFRTPLALIKGPVEQELENNPAPATRRRMQMVGRNVNRLMHLIGQLLDLTALETKHMSLRAVKTNIIPFVQGLAMGFASWAERRNLTLKIFSKETAIDVYIDRDLMEKILNNLLSNAIKFSRKGGVIETIIKRHDAKQAVELIIKDHGIGIPQDKLPHIFDRFYQVDASMTREHEGSGIGLALVKELVELHKGTISVASREGLGTTFTIVLPLGRAHLSTDEIMASVTESKRVHRISVNEFDFTHDVGPFHSDKTETSQEEKPLLLIVEDHADFRRFMIDTLHDAYRIIEATIGNTGLKKALEKIPDLIISDVMMPGMNGYELCDAVKRNDLTCHIPVILLTAKAAPDDKLEGLGVGADDYLSKPFDSRELLSRVQNLITQRRKLQAYYQQHILIKTLKKPLLSTDEQFLQKALTIVEEHLENEKFSVDDLAGGLGMSRSQMHRKIHALTGKAATHFIRAIRLQHAAEFIRADAGNITEIAYKVGFGSQSYFTRCFAEQFGCSPSEYKRKHA